MTRNYLEEAYQIFLGKPLPLSGCYLVPEIAHITALVNELAAVAKTGTSVVHELEGRCAVAEAEAWNARKILTGAMLRPGQN